VASAEQLTDAIGKYLAQHPVTDAFLAPEGLHSTLKGELKEIAFTHGDLFLAPRQTAYFAQNIWRDVKLLPVPSISKGAEALRRMQRDWAPYTVEHHRRTQLIVEQLPKVSRGPIEFGVTAPPKKPLGSFSLLTPDTMLAAADCASLYPNGAPDFVENHHEPASRAYLKLWEAFTVAGVQPKPGEKCLELGASPGGWTWVLANLGADVVAIDRSPLADHVAAMPGVSWQKGDAFRALPEKVGKIDWLFSDLACYPAKLLEFIKIWLNSGLVRSFVCTLKFQGDSGYGVTKEFAQIEGSRLIHLFHNKHELTWILLR
jgi:23S rRNA (cytidine2498-2'-O)-methyltransferase